MHFVLASNSPRRREILSDLGYAFDVRTADFDESTVDLSAPADGVRELALGKAEAAAKAAPAGEPTVFLGADTVVVLDGVVMGKPADEEDAFRMLRALSGRTHVVYTGAAVISIDETGAVTDRQTLVEATDVTFFALTDEEIRAYIATGEPMDKAGAYGIQGLGCTLVEGIRGDYLTVVGLPAARVVRLLKSVGVGPSADPYM